MISMKVFLIKSLKNPYLIIKNILSNGEFFDLYIYNDIMMTWTIFVWVINILCLICFPFWIVHKSKSKSKSKSKPKNLNEYGNDYDDEYVYVDHGDDYVDESGDYGNGYDQKQKIPDDDQEDIFDDNDQKDDNDDEEKQETEDDEEEPKQTNDENQLQSPLFEMQIKNNLGNLIPQLSLSHGSQTFSDLLTNQINLDIIYADDDGNMADKSVPENITFLDACQTFLDVMVKETINKQADKGIKLELTDLFKNGAVSIWLLSFISKMFRKTPKLTKPNAIITVNDTQNVLSSIQWMIESFKDSDDVNNVFQMIVDIGVYNLYICILPAISWTDFCKKIVKSTTTDPQLYQLLKDMEEEFLKAIKEVREQAPNTEKLFKQLYNPPKGLLMSSNNIPKFKYWYSFCLEMGEPRTLPEELAAYLSRMKQYKKFFST